jgi:hypothetical protein
VKLRILGFVVLVLWLPASLMAQSGESVDISGDWMDSQTWRDLSPLRSTRVEIEKRFGKPMLEGNRPRHAIYKDEQGMFSFIYSSGDCTVVGDLKWKAPTDTLLRIDIYPVMPFPISKAWFREHKFVEKEDLDVHQIYYRKDGVSVTVQSEDSKVFRVTYFPASKQKDFQCQ